MLIAETKRLIIREISAADAADIFNLNANPEVIRYTSDPAFKSTLDAVKLIEQVIRKQYTDHGHGRWAVVLKESNIFIGWCGLKYLADTNEIDLGYRFLKEYWGKGYATESSLASLQYGFDHFSYHEMIGRVMKENKNSIRVLEKCGMQFSHEAELHEHPAFVYKVSRESFQNHLRENKLLPF